MIPLRTAPASERGDSADVASAASASWTVRLPESDSRQSDSRPTVTDSTMKPNNAVASAAPKPGLGRKSTATVVPTAAEASNVRPQTTAMVCRVPSRRCIRPSRSARLTSAVSKRSRQSQKSVPSTVVSTDRGVGTPDTARELRRSSTESPHGVDPPRPWVTGSTDTAAKSPSSCSTRSRPEPASSITACAATFGA